MNATQLEAKIKRIAIAALWVFAASAHGAVIAVAQQGKSRLELHDRAGPCLGSARLAVHSDDVQRIAGCWLVGPQGVTVAFLDGDFISVPLAAFRKPQDL